MPRDSLLDDWDVAAIALLESVSRRSDDFTETQYHATILLRHNTTRQPSVSHIKPRLPAAEEIMHCITMAEGSPPQKQGRLFGVPMKRGLITMSIILHPLGNSRYCQCFEPLSNGLSWRMSVTVAKIMLLVESSRSRLDRGIVFHKRCGFHVRNEDGGRGQEFA